MIHGVADQRVLKEGTHRFSQSQYSIVAKLIITAARALNPIVFFALSTLRPLVCLILGLITGF